MTYTSQTEVAEGNTSSNTRFASNGMKRMYLRHGIYKNSHPHILVQKPLRNQFIHYHISRGGTFCINHFKLHSFAVVAIYFFLQQLIDVLYILRHDGQDVIEWFAKNCTQANPDKFHFVLFSPTPPEQQALQLCDGTYLMSETEVTVLGVAIDDRSCFSLHIRSWCKKAAWQLNALARISKHINMNSRRAIPNSFIMSNFNYCPLVWHFCGQAKNRKLEQIQERALRILFADYNSPYLGLVKRAGITSLLIQWYRLIVLTVFKSLDGLNPPRINDMFTPKYVPYQLRDSSFFRRISLQNHNIWFQISVSVSYIGAKLWNDLPNAF